MLNSYLYADFNLEVILISGVSMESDSSHVYNRRNEDTEIVLENLHPEFYSNEERDKVKSQIVQTLYEVFAKYEVG